MYETFALGAKAYLGWAVIVLLCLPWLFMWASEPINFWGR
jgi:4-amino-4-deoxy-L-arabinose transferase-like glycosyltransferase